MKKRILSMLLAAALAFSGAPSAWAGYENFTEQQTYIPFSDVPEDAWYAENVRLAYAYGLLNGKSANAFEPSSNLTIAEAVKLAVYLNSIYQTGAADFEPSETWYRVYADYALENHILSEEPEDYNQPITRAQFAKLFAAALPKEAFSEKNTVDDNAIPDVPITADYAESVYLLYRAGILTGSDEEGNFQPDGLIRRSETAAIITRMANPSLRQEITLTIRKSQPLSAEEISSLCMPAVFKIYSYLSDDNLMNMGSGVLVSADGKAVTCAHVVNGCSRAVAELNDGTQYPIQLYNLNVSSDLALIQLEGNMQFPYLETCDETAIGNMVYALGYPGGGDAHIASGQVFNPRNTDFATSRIESSASALSGNSGGALVNIYGQLLGIVSSSKESGVPSYSSPMSLLPPLPDDAEAVSFSDYMQTHLPDAETCYTDFYPTPDFGKLLEAPLFQTIQNDGQTVFLYRVKDLSLGTATAIQSYELELNKNTFYVFNGVVYTSVRFPAYSVTMRSIIYENQVCLGIVIAQ